MLRALRTGIKYFALGLLAGLVLAPRKGSETFKLLVGRGKEYVGENLGMGEKDR